MFKLLRLLLFGDQRDPELDDAGPRLVEPTTDVAIPGSTFPISSHTSYDLARIMVAQLSEDWASFRAFVLAANLVDAVAAAAALSGSQ